MAPEARRRDALLSFAFVYPTKTGHFTVKEVTGSPYPCLYFDFGIIYSYSLLLLHAYQIV